MDFLRLYRIYERFTGIFAAIDSGRDVIVGLSSGDVRRCYAHDLGISDGVPIRFGDAAKHPWLRCLSDE